MAKKFEAAEDERAFQLLDAMIAANGGVLPDFISID